MMGRTRRAVDGTRSPKCQGAARRRLILGLRMMPDFSRRHVGVIGGGSGGSDGSSCSSGSGSEGGGGMQNSYLKLFPSPQPFFTFKLIYREGLKGRNCQSASTALLLLCCEAAATAQN